MNESLPPRWRTGRGTRTDKAPLEAGLYAWYVAPEAGAGDWAAERDAEGTDLGFERFISFLDRLRGHLAEPTLDVDIVGRFASRWSGTAERSEDRLDGFLESRGRRAASEHLSQSAGVEEARGALLGWLSLATPLLTAPVYIGMTDRPLQDRLGEHMDDLEDAIDQLDATRDIDKRLSGTFGGRAAMVGLVPESLTFFAIPVDLSTVEPASDARSICLATEYVLNRTYRPLLGEV